MVTSSEKDRKAVRQKKKERDAANSKTVKKQSKSSVAKSDDLPAAVVKEIDAAIKKSQRQSAINKGELPAGKKKVKSTVVKSDKLPADTKIKNDFKMHTKGFDDNTEIIIKLHTEVKLALASAFENAIAIGDLLFRQKAVIPYGEFGAWIEKLPMEVRTAQRYMKLFMYQKPLAKKRITTITNAYHWIFGEPIADQAGSRYSGVRLPVLC